jgi:hypothetical protein
MRTPHRSRILAVMKKKSALQTEDGSRMIATEYMPGKTAAYSVSA